MSEKNVTKIACVQAAPVYCDIDATVEKAIGLIEEAAKNGAQFIGFPELWIPGYNLFTWLSDPVSSMRFIPLYRKNAMVVGGKYDFAIREAAARNGIYVSYGYSELAGGSLYMGQMLVSSDGEPLVIRRKIKPTLAERCTFGEGDGSGLAVVDTPIGRLGQLQCWEHTQSLLKYAMHSQNEQIHVAAWPCMALHSQVYAIGEEMTHAFSRVYAAEGQCYVMAATHVADVRMREMLCDTPEKEEMLKLGFGCSQIFGPDGSALCEPIPHDQEGLLYADADFDFIHVCKTTNDPAGHYSRPDVVRLLLNKAPASRVVLMDEFMRSPVEDGDVEYIELADDDVDCEETGA